MPRYVFREPPLTLKNLENANAQRIGEALEKIAVEHDGDLTPAAVVEAAKSRSSPLYRHFEWNDQKAAEAHRLNQARVLIRAIRIEDIAEEPVQAFLSIASTTGVSYRAASEVLSSVDLQRRVLAQAERDLLAFEVRYKSLSAICTHIRQARDALAKWRTTMESRAQ